MIKIKSLIKVKNSGCVREQSCKNLEFVGERSTFASSISKRADPDNRITLYSLTLKIFRKGNKNEKIVFKHCSHAEHDYDICRERERRQPE